MVKNIPCPNCGTACPDEGLNAKEVNINLAKDEFGFIPGTQLVLTCPNPKCRRQFIVQRQRIKDQHIRKKPKN